MDFPPTPEDSAHAGWSDPGLPAAGTELRERLMAAGLSEHELAPEPVEQFRRWFDLARSSGFHEPEATVVSTVDSDGQPSSRYVLMRGVDARGFAFYTNRTSRKGGELGATPKASMLFPWHLLARQVRIEGVVEQVSDEESDAYFATRPRGSRIGAWASEQSAVIADRADLDRRVALEEARWEGRDVERPPHWGGYRVVPHAVEFWQGRPNRLHDRLRYRRDDVGSPWVVERLSP